MASRRLVTAGGFAGSAVLTYASVSPPSIVQPRLGNPQPPKPRFRTVEDAFRHVGAGGGFCCVDHVLPLGAVEYWQHQAKSRCVREGREVTPGRWHCTLLKEYQDRTTTTWQQVNGLEQALARSLSSYFKDEQYEVTEVQVLNSKAHSGAQFFHADNTSRGLTLLVALDGIPLERGPTELLVGTASWFELSTGSIAWSKVLKSIVLTVMGTKSGGHSLHAVQATLPEGSAVLFDCRTIHRGLGNLTEKDRPVLVIRWDRKGHSPPGNGIFGTILVRILGNLLSHIVPSGARQS